MSDRIANLKDAYGNSIKINNEQVTSTTGGQALVDDPTSGITVHGYTQTGIGYVPATTFTPGQTYHIIVPAGSSYSGVNSMSCSSFSNINTSITPITRSSGSSGQGIGCSVGSTDFFGVFFLNSGVQTCYQCLDGTSTSSFEADAVYSGDGEEDDPNLTKYFYVESPTTVATINSTGILKCASLTDGTITKTMTQILSTEVPTNMVTTDTAQTISGEKTFSSGKLKIYDIKNPVGATISLPASTGTLALTSDIPSLTNYVTTNTEQTISGEKTFSSGKLKIYDIKNPVGATISLPASTGTLALTSQIPSLTNFVTLDGTQTITGTKTFSSGALKATNIKTSDGTINISTFRGTLNFPTYNTAEKTLATTEDVTNGVATGTASCLKYNSEDICAVSGKLQFGDLSIQKNSSNNLEFIGTGSINFSGPGTGIIDATNMAELKVPKVTATNVIASNVEVDGTLIAKDNMSGTKYTMFSVNQTDHTVNLGYSTNVMNSINLNAQTKLNNTSFFVYNNTNRAVVTLNGSTGLTIGNDTDSATYKLKLAKGFSKVALYTDINGNVLPGTHYMHKLQITDGTSDSGAIINAILINTSSTAISSITSVNTGNLAGWNGYINGGGYFCGPIVGLAFNLADSTHKIYYISTNSGGTASNYTTQMRALSGTISVTDTVIPIA